MSVTPTVPQETFVSCFHRSRQLLPGSSAVSVYLEAPLLCAREREES